MREELRNIIEENDWRICNEEDGYTLETYSPKGEDFCFIISANNPVADIIDFASSFDADEHAEMWVRAKADGERDDIPSIRELIEDADDIKEMLSTLSNAVSKLSEKLSNS